MFTNQEKEWKAINHNWREKYNNLIEENAMVRQACDALKQQLAQQADELARKTSELQEAKAQLFDQTQEIREALHQAQVSKTILIKIMQHTLYTPSFPTTLRLCLK